MPLKPRRDYLNYAKRYGFDPNHPVQDYDYRAAFRTGTTPKRWGSLSEADRKEDVAQGRNLQPNTWMWPDKFKGPEHKFPPKNKELNMPTRREYLLKKRKRQTSLEKERIERSRFGGARAPTRWESGEPRDWWNEPRTFMEKHITPEEYSAGKPQTGQVVGEQIPYTAPTTRGQLLERKQEGELGARRGRLKAQDIRQMSGRTLQPPMSPEEMANMTTQRRTTLPELYPEPTTRAAELGRFEGMLPPDVRAARETAGQAPAIERATKLGEIAETLPPESPMKGAIGAGAAQEIIRPTEGQPQDMLGRLMQQQMTTQGAGMAGELGGIQGMITPLDENSKSLLNLLADKRAEDEDSNNILANLLISLTSSLGAAQSPDEQNLIRNAIRSSEGYLQIQQWQDADSMLSQEQTGSGLVLGRHPLLWRKLGITEDRFTKTANLARQIVALVEGQQS